MYPKEILAPTNGYSLPALSYGIEKCASIVMEIKKNCEAILVIVAAGRQFFILQSGIYDNPWGHNL